MRYEKLERFHGMGKAGLARVQQSTVAIVGVGALGGMVAEMLARAGVKKLVVIDRDVVEVSNLQRQTLYGEEDVRKMKAVAAQERLERVNNAIDIVSHPVDLDAENVAVLEGADVIVDGTDNWYTRFLLNDFCRKHGIPFVHAAVAGGRGCVFTVVPDGPCVRCVVREPTGVVETCESEGVIGPAVQVIAGLQGAEVLRILAEQEPTREMLRVDVWAGVWERFRVAARQECPTCLGDFEFLSGVKRQDVVKVCGAHAFQFRITPDMAKQLAERVKKLGPVVLTQHCLFFENIVLFQDGRVLVKAPSVEAAKTLYAKYVG